jgi:hypothetical protein
MVKCWPHQGKNFSSLSYLVTKCTAVSNTGNALLADASHGSASHGIICIFEKVEKSSSPPLPTSSRPTAAPHSWCTASPNNVPPPTSAAASSRQYNPQPHGYGCTPVGGQQDSRPRRTGDKNTPAPPLSLSLGCPSHPRKHTLHVICKTPALVALPDILGPAGTNQLHHQSTWVLCAQIPATLFSALAACPGRSCGQAGLASLWYFAKLRHRRIRFFFKYPTSSQSVIAAAARPSTEAKTHGAHVPWFQPVSDRGSSSALHRGRGTWSQHDLVTAGQRSLQQSGLDNEAGDDVGVQVGGGAAVLVVAALLHRHGAAHADGGPPVRHAPAAEPPQSLCEAHAHKGIPNSALQRHHRALRLIG